MSFWIKQWKLIYQLKKKRHKSENDWSQKEGGEESSSGEEPDPPKETSSIKTTPIQEKRKSPYFSKTETRVIWTREEEKNLEAGVAMFSAGNWASILEHYKFNEKRNAVSLKDKWRNMQKKRARESTKDINSTKEKLKRAVPVRSKIVMKSLSLGSLSASRFEKAEDKTWRKSTKTKK